MQNSQNSIVLDHILASLKPKAAGDSAIDAARTLLRAAESRSILRRSDVSELYSKSVALVANANGNSHAHKTAGCIALTAFATYGPLQLFLEGFLQWGAEGLEILKSATIKSSSNAAWCLLTSIFDRLSVNSFSYAVEGASARKDVFQLASKLCSSVVSTLSDGLASNQPISSLTLALTTLNAVLSATPGAAKSYYQALEQPLLQLILRDGESLESAPLVMDCLTSLPQCYAENEAWCTLTHRLLATAHVLLDELQIPVVSSLSSGVDGNGQRQRKLPNAVFDAFEIPKTNSMKKVGVVFDCLARLLIPKIPPSYAVGIPVEGILGLVERILSCTFAVPTSVSRGRLVNLYLELPSLHISSLKLLRTMVQALSTSCTPWLLTATRLIDGHLRTVIDAMGHWDDKVRLASYATCRVLMHGGGLAVARLLAPTLVDECSKVEFYQSFATEPSSVALQIDEQRLNDRLSVKVQIEYLGILETVLAVGGEGLDKELRIRAEDIIAHVSFLLESRPWLKNEAWLDSLQLAAYKALLASVLSPLDGRPLHLGLSLSLFGRGCSSRSVELSEFCTHALLCCEALMHPRTFSSKAGSESKPSHPGFGILPNLWVWSDSLALEALEVLESSKKKMATVKRDGDDAELGNNEEPAKAKQRLVAVGVGKESDYSALVIEPGSGPIVSENIGNEEKDDEVSIPVKHAEETVTAFGTGEKRGIVPENEPLMLEDKTKPHQSNQAGSFGFTALRDEGGDDDSDDLSLPEIDSGVSSGSDDSEGEGEDKTESEGGA